MAVLLTRTFAGLQIDVGYNLGALQEGTLTDDGTTATFLDKELDPADGYINGRQWRGISSPNAGEIRIVDSYVGSTAIGTLRGDTVSATKDGNTYELWSRDFRIAAIKNFINRGIRSMVRKGSPPLTDQTSLHASRELRLYDVPTAMIGIESIWWRFREARVDIDNCDAVWDELVDSDVTASINHLYKREGSAANKFELAAGLGAGDLIATKVISVDLSGMTHLEGWINTDVALDAGDLQIVLSTTANAATQTELLDIPAITSSNLRTWIRFSIALANPEDDTAIISIGLLHTVDKGAATIHLDAIDTTREDSGDWEELNWNFWDVNRDQRKIRFSNEAVLSVGHSLLKLVGRKKPSELSADSDVCDIDPEWLIQQASSVAMRARGDRSAERRDAAYIEANDFAALAQLRMRHIQGPSKIRWVDN